MIQCQSENLRQKNCAHFAPFNCLSAHNSALSAGIFQKGEPLKGDVANTRSSLLDNSGGNCAPIPHGGENRIDTLPKSSLPQAIGAVNCVQIADSMLNSCLRQRVQASEYACSDCEPALPGVPLGIYSRSIALLERSVHRRWKGQSLPDASKVKRTVYHFVYHCDRFLPLETARAISGQKQSPLI